MNKDKIKAAYLKAIGNPESGVLVEIADQIVDAIAEELNPKEVKEYNPVKEQRVIKPTETR